VDLEKKECSCRYRQLSGLPCPHAISCIFFKTNTPDDYIVDFYTVEEFNKTYSYCVLPVEGMKSWPQSDWPPLEAPGYVRMPGRPKMERTREPHEQPKAAKLSRVCTVIRCTKCKQIGHNRSTCEKEILHLLLLVKNQKQELVVKVVLLLHIKNQLWWSPLNKALQQLRQLGKGRLTLPLQRLHQKAWVVLQQKKM
jgi:hypothetical protein